MVFDLSLYAVFDPGLVAADAVASVRQAVAGGATLVQLRYKGSSARDFLSYARALKASLAETATPLIINDRVDVAAACGADGVHVGQDDLPPQAARAILGPKAIIGLTVRSEDEARAAPLDVIDYVGLGGVFATQSKTNETAPLGIDGFRYLAGLLKSRKPGLPVCGIAGINAENCAAVIAAGADGVAMISAIFSREDARVGAEALAAEIAQARAVR